jgi:hypothetical protein
MGITRRRRVRAICSARCSLRSGFIAVSLVWLPQLINFAQHGQWNREELVELLRTLVVAVLIVLFNFLQMLQRPRARRRHKPRGKGAAR